MTQLDFFDTNEVDILKREIESLRKEVSNLRRGLFKRFSDLSKSFSSISLEVNGIRTRVSSLDKMPQENICLEGILDQISFQPYHSTVQLEVLSRTSKGVPMVSCYEDLPLFSANK